MKRISLIAIAMLSILSIRAFAGTDYIAQSKHNFSTMAWAGGEICKPCHTPHFAAPSTVSSRLWNHALTNATYTLSGGATGTAEEDMDNRSRLCLSCHDGTVALDSFGGATGASFMTPSANLGTDLSNDHPVGKEAVVKDESEGGRYKPITYSSSPTATSGKIGALTIYATGTTHSITNPDGSTTVRPDLAISCYTCHNAHGSGIGGASSPNFLRMSNAASAMCLTCHYK